MEPSSPCHEASFRPMAAAHSSGDDWGSRRPSSSLLKGKELSGTATVSDVSTFITLLGTVANREGKWRVG